MTKTRLHILGASGYGAGEMLRYLQHHPFFDVVTLESGSAGKSTLGDVFPELRRFAIGKRTFDPRGSVNERLERDDVIILAGSHELALEAGPALLERGVRVLDLSDGFRLDWRARGSVYGLTETYREEIRHARLLANPGCFPTTAMLSISPLERFRERIVTMVFDIKSGISGAGRTPKVGSLLSELEGEVRPYGLTGHRHIPEIAQEAQALGINAPFSFSPQVVPIARGMLGMSYVIFDQAPSIDEISRAFHERYMASPFITMLASDQAPSLRAVARSNNVEISISLQANTLRVICALDNLGKGAAGQALQNLNVMYGYPEETCLQ